MNPHASINSRWRLGPQQATANIITLSRRLQNPQTRRPDRPWKQSNRLTKHPKLRIKIFKRMVRACIYKSVYKLTEQKASEFTKRIEPSLCNLQILLKRYMFYSLMRTRICKCTINSAQSEQERERERGSATVEKNLKRMRGPYG